LNGAPTSSGKVIDRIETMILIGPIFKNVNQTDEKIHMFSNEHIFCVCKKSRSVLEINVMNVRTINNNGIIMIMNFSFLLSS